MTESPLICCHCTSTHQQDNNLIMTSYTQLLSSWSVGWFLLIQTGGGLWLPLNKTINSVCYFFFFLMMSRIGTLPRGAPQKHVKNKNMITVYWGEFPAHLSSARLIALMLWWLWSPQHYDHWFHQMQRDHISNDLSSTRKIMSACTAADAATDIVTAFLWFQPNIESPFIYSQKKRKISLWGLYSTQNYS